MNEPDARRQRRMHPAMRRFRAAKRKMDLNSLAETAIGRLRLMAREAWNPLRKQFYDERGDLESFTFLIQESRLGNGKRDRLVVSCNGIKIVGHDDAEGTMHSLFYSDVDKWLRQFDSDALVILFGVDVLVEVGRASETIRPLYDPKDEAA
jgi:hypothetical protein